jgi:c-di-GMP-binding flagellar brake protein YcgR
MKNRRQALRMTVMGIVRIALPGDSRTIEAYLANISRGGIGIYLHRKVRVGQKIRITVRLKGEWEREEEIGAEVTWVSRAGDLYMVGVEFERLPKDQYQAVMNNLIP